MKRSLRRTLVRRVRYWAFRFYLAKNFALCYAARSLQKKYLPRQKNFTLQNEKPPLSAERQGFRKRNTCPGKRTSPCKMKNLRPLLRGKVPAKETPAPAKELHPAK
ncbi:hypothetical protein [Chitinophaga niabensis]|uniref:hypothetical protein n=1 Tax=Chitinophaga niabensis TaxID=536979 RepID=UPI0011611FD5|nr:hypothetical protein [Chitinophaga niabensis]